MSDKLAMDVLAKMGEDWMATTAAMINTTIGALCLRMGIKEINLPVAPERIAELLMDYDIKRTYFERDGEQWMKITVTEK